MREYYGDISSSEIGCPAPEQPIPIGFYFFLPCAATASMAAFTFSGSPR